MTVLYNDLIRILLQIGLANSVSFSYESVLLVLLVTIYVQRMRSLPSPSAHP